MKATHPLLRKDVPEDSRWNKEAVYDSWAAWEAEYALALAELPKVAAFQNRLGEGPDTLLAWFEESARQWDRELRLFVYATMAAAVDSSDTEAKAYEGLALDVWAQLAAASSFAEPELTAIGEKLLHWAVEQPALCQYRHYFEELLRRARHRRSDEVEEVLGMLQGAFYNVGLTARELTNTDLTFADAVDSQGKRHEVYRATISPAGIKSHDREHRRTAWESFYDGHAQVRNTLASNYLTCVKQTVALAKIRGHDSVLEMMLAPSGLPVAAFANVMDAFEAELPLWHRYWDVRRKVLGLDALHPYDVWAPLVQEEPAIPYRQGVEWLCEAMAPLGEGYVALIRQACFEERWVDHAPNKEKEQGAASFCSTPAMPAFIFTRYEGSVACLRLLAHELGHSLHFYLAANNQPQVYRRFDTFSLAIAETASIFHEAMLLAHLQQSRQDDKALQIALLDDALAGFHSYFLLSPLLAAFEREVYRRAQRNQPLSAPIFDEIMAGLFAEAYGDTMVDDPQRTQSTWARFPHLYDPFYSFQYALGIVAAYALAERVRSGGAEAANAYLDFLKAGSSLSPPAAWKLAGVDMTTPQPVKKTFGLLAAQIDQLEALAA